MFGGNYPGPQWVNDAKGFANNPLDPCENFGPRVDTMDVVNGNAAEPTHTFNHTYVGWIFNEQPEPTSTRPGPSTTPLPAAG